jgi:tRNA dimethylallyltransferase
MGSMAKGRLPFLVGGTGQYIRAIVEGWRIPPQKPDLALRDAITHWAEEIGPEGLYKRLERLTRLLPAKLITVTCADGACA